MPCGQATLLHKCLKDDRCIVFPSKRLHKDKCDSGMSLDYTDSSSFDHSDVDLGAVGVEDKFHVHLARKSFCTHLWVTED